MGEKNYYETVKNGFGGFNEMTVCRTIALMLGQFKVPTIESNNVVKFKPIGSSTFGGYIYRSGVIMIFNDHTAPFSTSKLSLKDALKELMHKTRFGFMALYKQIERDRAIWLMKIGKTYEDVFGYEGELAEGGREPDKRVKIRVQPIPEDEISGYADTRFVYKNSIYQKFYDGETTLWDTFRLIQGKKRSARSLERQTNYARENKQKTSLPVIYPNFHVFSEFRVPNRLTMLDFDLIKQGVDLIKAKRIRDTVSCMPEIICVCDSFTNGNFWALAAIGETVSKYREFSEAVCDEIEKRLAVFGIQIDRCGCLMKQARFLVHDADAIIKNPSRRFYEASELYS